MHLDKVIPELPTKPVFIKCPRCHGHGYKRHASQYKVKKRECEYCKGKGGALVDPETGKLWQEKPQTVIETKKEVL